jgi:hypothetical protein
VWLAFGSPALSCVVERQVDLASPFIDKLMTSMLDSLGPAGSLHSGSLTCPENGGALLLYTAYFDEADTHGPSPTVIMACFLGHARQWELFGRRLAE